MFGIILATKNSFFATMLERGEKNAYFGILYWVLEFTEYHIYHTYIMHNTFLTLSRQCDLSEKEGHPNQ